jgi:NAD dependent epimerase/dehydratase family enzyme
LLKQATGLVGRKLSSYLEEKGIAVIRISQSAVNPSDERSLSWNPSEGKFPDSSRLEGVDAVIHLAGENVASGEGIFAYLGRWTEAKKQVR